MNIFPRRREAALSELKLPETVFQPTEDADGLSAPPEPGETTAVAPANELVTALVALDIAESIRADVSAPTPTPTLVPAPLSQRHLETIDRMVEHLKAGELRLREQMAETRQQLADTRVARRAYERNRAELRRGIAVLIQRADAELAVSAARPPRPGEDLQDSDAGDEAIAAISPRRRRGMH